MIRIVTDSTCDLPQDWFQTYNLHVVPINIHFGQEAYLEGQTIDPPSFYRKVAAGSEFPKTSQPSVGQFTTAYRQVAKPGDQILSIHVTGKLSGTVRSAEMAREELKGEMDIQVFDSLCGSAAMGYMCVEAAQMAGEGKSMAEIIRRLEEIRSRIHIFLTVENLEYAKRSGRVGALGAALASFLNVKPIIVLEDGVLEAKERVRTWRKAVDRMVEMMGEAVGSSAPVNLAVIHAEAHDEAQKLAEDSRKLFNAQTFFVSDLATSIAVQLGPGTVGLVGYQI
ncbi:MAG: DegV family protein [Chloroflexi bacterium]|nr:DegV family protein [Chloroflexota bacterium]